MLRRMALRERDPYLLGAIACLLATWPALLGVSLGVYAALWWSVATAYVGISWLAPGVLLGAWAARRARTRSARRPNLRGVLVGVVSCIGLLAVLSTLLVASVGEDIDSSSNDVVESLPTLESDSTEVRGSPAIGSQQDRVSLVTQATLENVEGVDAARPIDTPSDGGHGTYNEESGEIGCFWDINPPAPVP